MKIAYVMLTGDDGVPKVLALSLFTLPERAACLWLFLAQQQPAVLWRRRRTDVFPVAASSGRLALHGHVSTTNARVDSGGGEGGCGLFYLISVSTCASV